MTIQGGGVPPEPGANSPGGPNPGATMPGIEEIVAAVEASLVPKLMPQLNQTLDSTVSKALHRRLEEFKTELGGPANTPGKNNRGQPSDDFRQQLEAERKARQEAEGRLAQAQKAQAVRAAISGKVSDENLAFAELMAAPLTGRPDENGEQHWFGNKVDPSTGLSVEASLPALVDNLITQHAVLRKPAQTPVLGAGGGSPPLAGGAAPEVSLETLMADPGQEIEVTPEQMQQLAEAAGFGERKPPVSPWA